MSHALCTAATPDPPRKEYKPKRRAQRKKMNRLSKPVGTVMKKVVTNGKAKTAVEWAEYHAGQSPGPGEYDVTRRANWKPEAAGKFGKGKLPVSDIDRRVKENVPGPGEYDLIGYLDREKSKEGCVKLTKGTLMKSDIDWKICYAKDQPGPSDYEICDSLTSRIRGGRFNKGHPKSDIDWRCLAARHSSPGPGAYVTGSSTSLTKGSRISKSERWRYRRAAASASPTGVEEEKIFEGTPGPGTYDVDAVAKCLAFKGGPKMAAGKPSKSDVEWRIYEHGTTPGPGHYLLPSTLTKTSGGRFPMVYTPQEPEKAHLAKAYHQQQQQQQHRSASR